MHRGEAALAPAVQSHVLAAASASTPVAGLSALPDGLTPREAEVLRLIAAGRSDARSRPSWSSLRRP